MKRQIRIRNKPGERNRQNALIRQRAKQRLMELHLAEYDALVHDEQHRMDWAHIHACSEHSHQTTTPVALVSEA